MKKTLTITVGIAIVAVVATVMAVHHQTIKAAYFEPDTDKLRLVPANIVVVRPTEFPKADAGIKHYHENDSLARTVGRNASFRDMMGEAYDCDSTKVVLPPGAPSGGFDFLVTMPSDVREHLRTAIKKQLGYVAHTETRDTDVLILMVQNPALPGFTLSAADEKDGGTYRNGKLYLTHQQMDTIVDSVSKGLDQPVLDQTGLTNYYDFSVVWNPEIAKRMQHGEFDATKTGQALARWGLGLESTNMPMDMLIVERAH
jgi:uncharacterized protein (TIGR03435 family)